MQILKTASFSRMQYDSFSMCLQLMWGKDPGGERVDFSDGKCQALLPVAAFKKGKR